MRGETIDSHGPKRAPLPIGQPYAERTAGEVMHDPVCHIRSPLRLTGSRPEPAARCSAKFGARLS